MKMILLCIFITFHMLVMDICGDSFTLTNRLSPTSEFKPLSDFSHFQQLEDLLLGKKFMPFPSTLNRSYFWNLAFDKIPNNHLNHRNGSFYMMVRSDPRGNPQFYIRLGNHVILHKDVLDGAEYHVILNQTFNANVPSPIVFSPYWKSSEADLLALSYLPWSIAVLLQMLEISENEWKEKVVLDLGSGMGVLSLFALNLGAKKIIAVEQNKSSLNTFKYNLSQNGFIKTENNRMVRGKQEVVFVQGSFHQPKVIKQINHEGAVHIILDNIGPSYGDAHFKAAHLIANLDTDSKQPVIHIGGGASALKIHNDPGNPFYRTRAGSSPLLEQIGILKEAFDVSKLDTSAFITPWNVEYPVLHSGRLPPHDQSTPMLFRASKVTLTPKQSLPENKATLFSTLKLLWARTQSA